jgi:TRAP-type uncharacterized transport system substrate-binding protein
VSRQASSRTWLGWFEGKVAYSVSFGVGLMLLVGAGLVYYEYTVQSASQVIRIAYGSGGPVRRHFLEQLVKHGTAAHLDIRLTVTEGTQETLDLVASGEADLGLVAGGVAAGETDRIFEIAPLYMEPLQLLVRESLYDAVSKDFGELAGRSIGLDAEESATNLVATELLRFIGLIDASGQPRYRPVYMQQSELVAAVDPAALPEVIFQIGGLPSETIRRLITTHNYRLVALPFGEAFNLSTFRAADAPPEQTLDRSIDRALVEEFVIPAFTYSVLPAVPPVDVRTIATRLMLVGGAKVDVTTVKRMIGLLMSPDISDLARPPLSVDLLRRGFQFPRHPGVNQYLDSLTPIDVESAFVAYSRVVEVWGLIIAAYFAAAKGLKSWRLRNSVTRKSVGDFMLEVLAIEGAVTRESSRDDRNLLDQQLTALKDAAVRRHLDETLDDSETLPSLLTAVADARARLWGTASTP